MGAKIEVFKERNSISVDGNIRKYPLTGTTVDIGDIPDLFPILSVVGAFASGKTELYNASNVRGKESDRLSLVARGLRKMGVNVKEEKDKLTIYQCKELKGGEITHESDHRIAMAFTVAALYAKTPSQITNIEVVKDSYPNFLNDIKNLGGRVEELE